MVIEIDLTQLEDAKKDDLIKWKEGVELLMEKAWIKGDMGAIRALQVEKDILIAEMTNRGFKST